MDRECHGSKYTSLCLDSGVSGGDSGSCRSTVDGGYGSVGGNVGPIRRSGGVARVNPMVATGATPRPTADTVLNRRLNFR